ncbi:TonB-dependent receptor [uncultured Oxalicibacterium sp.]|uniref:TonB-dependent receptor n=1 Tax=uncultured Oxalicibacterium sp. TaxID=1168540 RepID=UPI0025E92785|nr:TonB-dependent receptor [uncultured Oxalicibacterium sp.]
MKKLKTRLTILAAGLTLSASVFAQSSPVDIDISSQPLHQALNALARQTGAQILFVSDITAGKTAPAIKGKLTVQEALSRLLQGSSLHIRTIDNRSFSIVSEREASNIENVLPQVNVTAASTGDLAPVYAGGQVARGGQLGMLGQRDVMDTPFSLTAYTSNLIQQQQADSIADVIANDASVQNINPRTSRFDQFSIRGFSLLNSDIALNGLYGIVPTYAVAVESLERVEVLKGSSAMINGMAPGGAVGGAINIVPKRAGDTPTREITTSYSSDSTVGAHLDLGQRFGEEGQFGVRLNGAYRSGDTAVDNQRQQRGLFTLGMDYRSVHTRLSADVGYQDRTVDAPQERVSLGANAPVPNANLLASNYAPAWTYAKSRDHYLATRAEHDVGEQTTIYGAFGIRKGYYDFLRQGITLNNATGNFSEQPNYFLRSESVRTAEVGLKTRAQTGSIAHAITTSATFLEKDFGNLSLSVSPTTNSNIYTPAITSAPSLAGLSDSVPKTNRSRLVSFALADTLSMMEDRVQLTIGGRLQRVVNERFQSNGSLNKVFDEQAWTPAVALLVKPWQHVSLYANYIEGLSEAPAIPTAAINQDAVFRPVKSKQKEIGAKFDYGKLGASVSLFEIRKPGGYFDTATNIFSVSGMQRNRGLEANIFGEPQRGLRLLAGVMYLDARTERSSVANTEGKVAQGSPRFTWNAGLDWDTPFLDGMAWSARVLHTTSQYVDATNIKEIPGWTRLDVGARYTFPAQRHPVTLRASITNLLDKTYWASASSNGLTISSPRALLLSATIPF